MDPQGKPVSKTPVFVWLACQAAIHTGSMLHAVLALGGQVPLTLPMYFGWQALFFLATVILLRLFWRRRRAFSLSANMAMLLWAGLVFWYCGPAPYFFVFSMHLDALQVVGLMNVQFKVLDPHI